MNRLFLKKLIVCVCFMITLTSCKGGDKFEIQDVAFTHGFDSEMKPVSQGKDFQADEKVCLSVILKGRPKEGVVKARFLWHDELIADVSYNLADKNSGVIFSFGEATYIGYTLTPDKPFPISDKYCAEVLYKDSLLGTYPFSILPPPGATPSKLISAVLSGGVDAEYNPVNPKTAFSPADKVYLAGRADMGLSSWIRADWYVEGKNDANGSRTITMKENVSDNPFSFAYVPEGGWPAGKHEVVLILNDEEVGRYSFTIE
jgi:hypothetical protein